MRVLLAGEGRTELGEWAKEAPLRVAPGETGVLLALLKKAGWHTVSPVDGILWRKIRKYRSGNHASPEERNVLGLTLSAFEAGCDALVFCRDRDGSEERQRDLERGIQQAGELFPNIYIVGGIAIEDIEAWILCLLGHDGEALRPMRTKTELERRCGITSLEGKVDAIGSASLESLRAGSLSAWVSKARDALASHLTKAAAVSSFTSSA